MTDEKIKAALDWIGDIHANIMIAFATAEQSHEAHKEAGKAISAIETLRAILEAQTSAGEEIWLDIPEWNGVYQVSSTGKVKNTKTNKLKDSFKDPKGYLRVGLSSNGKSRNYLVHRLVAYAFFGISSSQVDHKNGVRDDNRVENLEYVTNRTNSIRGKIRNGSTGDNKQFNRYRAEYWFEGKNYWAGSFKTREEAIKASEEAKAARRYAASQQTRGEVAEGYAIVKIEPTDEMSKKIAAELNFVFGECCKTASESDADYIYSVMLTASPTPPVAGKEK